jgi:hypothetical protein
MAAKAVAAKSNFFIKKTPGRKNRAQEQYDGVQLPAH